MVKSEVELGKFNLKRYCEEHLQVNQFAHLLGSMYILTF